MLVEMYYPQQSKEPSGCIQTIIITRLILMILFVPFLLVLGAIVAVIAAFYALTVHPLLALAALLAFAGAIVGVARWESKRIARDMPPDD